MLSGLTPQDAGIVIGALVSALVAVVGFAVWLIHYVLDDKDRRLATQDTQIISAIGQIARNGESVSQTLDQVAGSAREIRLILEMEYRGRLPATMPPPPEGTTPP